MGEWISINDRLPEKGIDDWVLVLSRFVPEGGFGVPLVAELRSGKWYGAYDEVIDREHCCAEVAYWAQLPAPPREDDDPC